MGKVIIGILFFCIVIFVFIIGVFLGLRYSSAETLFMKNCSDKYLNQLKLAVWWIKCPSKIMEYLNRHKYNNVCIYGMSYLGDCLGGVLNKYGVNVVCGIDRNADYIYSPFMPVYNISDEIPEADVVIVTALISYAEIEKELSKKLKADIVSLEDILYE